MKAEASGSPISECSSVMLSTTVELSTAGTIVRSKPQVVRCSDLANIDRQDTAKTKGSNDVTMSVASSDDGLEIVSN